jgi:hypothetical protein
MKDASIYFTLPLGMTLDQYRAMYKLENYRSEVNQDKIGYIEFDCAVISSPTPDEVGEMDQESIDTTKKYLELVAEMIQSYGVQTISTTEQFVNLKGDQGVWELDLKKHSIPDLKKHSNPEWKIILFKITKEPIVLPDVLLTRGEVETYFEISK